MFVPECSTSVSTMGKEKLTGLVTDGEEVPTNRRLKQTKGCSWTLPAQPHLTERLFYFVNQHIRAHIGFEHLSFSHISCFRDTKTTFKTGKISLKSVLPGPQHELGPVCGTAGTEKNTQPKFVYFIYNLILKEVLF